MPRQTPKANSSQRRSAGFSAIELLIMATIISIVTAFGLMGITRARASVRLSGAAREYASYVEKARIHSIRRHADDSSERATVAINANKTSYDVTMDLDGDGGMDTRTVTLPSEIMFETVESIAFDWRGRTLSTVDGVTTTNAQVSIRLLSSDDSISIDVTGSGDVTIDSLVFDDSVPTVSLNVQDLAAGATPVPTPVTAIPTPTPTLPLPVVVPTPSDNSGSGNSGSGNSGSGNSGSGSSGSGSGGGLPIPTPTPPVETPTPTPTPVPTPIPTPTPSVCTLTLDKSTVTISKDGTTTVRLSHNGSSNVSVNASSSKPSDLQVTPGGAQNVSAGGTATFTIKSKKSSGTYYVTFSAGCGSVAVVVIVLP